MKLKPVKEHLAANFLQIAPVRNLLALKTGLPFYFATILQNGLKNYRSNCVHEENFLLQHPDMNSNIYNYTNRQNQHPSYAIAVEYFPQHVPNQNRPLRQLHGLP